MVVNTTDIGDGEGDDDGDNDDKSSRYHGSRTVRDEDEYDDGGDCDRR